MKAILSIGLTVVLAVSAFGQLIGQSTNDAKYAPPTSTISSAEAQTGQLAGQTWTWTDTLIGSGSAITSYWRQTGYSKSAGLLSNQWAMRSNPEIFNIIIALEGLSGDSVGIGGMRFECALDTTDSTTYPIWIADSSNFLVADGNYNLNNYGTWTFEDIKGTLAQYCTGKVWLYTARVPCGGFIRLVSTPAAIEDSTKRTIHIWGER